MEKMYLSPSDQLKRIKNTIRLEWEWELYGEGKVKMMSNELASYLFEKQQNLIYSIRNKRARYSMNSTTQLAYWDSKKNGYYSIGKHDK